MNDPDDPKTIVVSLIVYYYPFNESPSLQNIALELQQSFLVQLLVDARFNLKEDIDASVPQSVEVTVPTGGTKKSLFRRFSALAPSGVKNLAIRLVALKNFFLPLHEFCGQIRRSSAAQIVIAADKSGLLASILGGKLPNIYYSLEVNPFWDEPNMLSKMLNLLEYVYIRMMNPYVISQSAVRASLLQIDKSRHIIIPVTSKGQPLPRSNYLRELFNIDPGKCIMLIAGGLGSDQLTSEIIDQVKYWPANWVLVLHSSSGNYSSQMLSKSHARDIEARVFLTQRSFSIAKAEELIYASADVGLVLYKNLSFNYRNTAYSSGKMAAFMRSGVPVIVPPFQEFEELLKVHKLGEVATVSQIPEKIFLVLSRYDSYRAAALLAYEDIYRFEGYQGKITKLIAKELNIKPHP